MLTTRRAFSVLLLGLGAFAALVTGLEDDPAEPVLTTVAGIDGALLIALALESRGASKITGHVEMGLRIVALSLAFALTGIASGTAVDRPVAAGAVMLMFLGLAALLEALEARQTAQ